MPRQKKEIVPLPYAVYFWTVATVTLAGLSDSLYLAVSHYRVYTDIGYRSFCAISRAINCDTVSQSPYSIMLGLPVPLWGVFGYGLLLLLLVFARHPGEKVGRIWTLLMLISLTYSLYSVVLALISTLYIHSYCMMCVVSYGINFFLVYFSWLVRKRYAVSGVTASLWRDVEFLWEQRRKSAPAFGLFAVLFVAVSLATPAYWQLSLATDLPDLPTGMTADGHPWIGAIDPELEIVEFADYQCFQCKKMHYMLRQLVAEQPTRLRLVHRHFPMDGQVNPIVHEPLHAGAGKLAMLAIYAAARGKFWEVNDLLFDSAGAIKGIDTGQIAAQTGLDIGHLAAALKDPRVSLKLRQDIIDGIRLGVTGTPTYVIDGKLYVGNIPPEVLTVE